jgi:hypothetical protein
MYSNTLGSKEVLFEEDITVALAMVSFMQLVVDQLCTKFMSGCTILLSSGDLALK